MDKICEALIYFLHSPYLKYSILMRMFGLFIARLFVQKVVDKGRSHKYY
jgi:hypothetical protein